MTIYVHPSSADGGDCPYRDRQYEVGEWVRAPKPYFMRGTMVHGARQWAVSYAQAQGDMPPEDDVIESGREHGKLRQEEDAAKGVAPLEPEDFAEAFDEAVPLIQTDYRLVLPRVAPHVVAIEEKLEADLGDDIILTGTVDLRGRDPVTETSTLDDLKTAAKAPGKDAVLRAALSPQLSLYAALLAAHGHGIPRMSLTYVWSMKRGPSDASIEKLGLRVTKLPFDLVGVSRTIPTTRSRADINAALHRVRIRVQREREGIYPPATASGITIPCMTCEHWGAGDPSQRCPFSPEERPAT